MKEEWTEINEELHQLRDDNAKLRAENKRLNMEWTKTVADMSAAHDDDRLQAARELAKLRAEITQLEIENANHRRELEVLDDKLAALSPPSEA